MRTSRLGGMGRQRRRRRSAPVVTAAAGARRMIAEESGVAATVVVAVAVAAVWKAAMLMAMRPGLVSLWVHPCLTAGPTTWR